MPKTDPIGGGLLCPFRRDEKGDFANGTGLEVLKSDIGELLGLRGPTATEPGELAWDTERGTGIHGLQHRHIHSEMTRALADQHASGAIMRFEPRVRAGVVTVDTEGGNTLLIRVSYRPLGFLRSEEENVEVRV